MGANLGTTITAQLIAFNLTDFAPLAVAIGVGFGLPHQKNVQKKFGRNSYWIWDIIYWYGYDEWRIKTLSR